MGSRTLGRCATISPSRIDTTKSGDNAGRRELMKFKRRSWLVAVLGAVVLSAPAAIGHPGHPDHDSGSRELFPGEGVALDDQHGVTEGHLPPVSKGVRLVGKAEVTNPSGAGN